MELKKLEVPTSSITEVKKSPMTVFDQARHAGTGVYIFNREKIAGVMLTKEQYEGLLEELNTLRQADVADTTALPTPPQVESEVVAAEPEATIAEPVVPAGLEELDQTLRQALVAGTVVSARYLDEQLVFSGFITKKSGFGGVTEILRELQTNGKVVYQLRRKENGKQVYAEIYGELSADQTDRLKLSQITLVAR